MTFCLLRWKIGCVTRFHNHNQGFFGCVCVLYRLGDQGVHLCEDQIVCVCVCVCVDCLVTDHEMIRPHGEILLCLKPPRCCSCETWDNSAVIRCSTTTNLSTANQISHDALWCTTPIHTSYMADICCAIGCTNLRFFCFNLFYFFTFCDIWSK